MNTFRKAAGLLIVATMLAGFALPAFSASDKKTYSLQMSVPPGQTTAPFTVTGTVTNQGNSTISSFNLFVAGVTIVGVNPPSTGNATFTGSSVAVKNMHPLKSGDSLTLTIRVNSCGDGQWSAAVWSGSSLNGQTFALTPPFNLATPISCGDLAAGAEFIVPDSLNPDCVSGMRGFYDSDGSVPVTVPFFVTNTIPTNAQLHFRWPDDNTGDPLATFEYTVCASGPIPAPGTTNVAWKNTDGTPASTPGTPSYVTAQECLAPKTVPAPYGTLVADLSSSATTLTLNALTPTGAHGSIAHSLPPFDVVIGNERMTVTDVFSDEGPAGDLSDPNELSEDEVEIETWTLVRAVGGTAAAAHSASAITLVMSTPLPLLPTVPAPPFPYIGGNQAQMCIAAQFLEGGGHATTFIDIGGDGFGRNP